jgi:very-short-patch-repair endonuclease
MATQRNSGRGIWKEIARVAEGQHGVVSHAQLRAAGLTRAGITRAVDGGRLFPIFRSAFAVGHRGIGESGRRHAATLACGEGSVLSHGTAAFVWGLWEFQPAEIDVIAPIEAGRKISGIRRRFVPAPAGDERTLRHGVPITSPSRTIVDVAGIVRPGPLARTVEQAAVLGALDIAEVDYILARHRRRGAPALRVILEEWRRHRPEQRLRSVLEAKLQRLLSRSRLPPPETNTRLVAGTSSFEVDFLWREQRLVVETDGRRFHVGPAAARRDAFRDAALEQAGFVVIRLDWSDVLRRPETTVAKIAKALDSSGSAVP